VHLASFPISLNRRMAGIALFVLFAGLAAILSMGVGRASAMVVWCAGDPTIIVNGTPVSVTVFVPFDEISSVSDVTVTYHVAKDANVRPGLDTPTLFHETVVIVKDQPAQYGSLSVSNIPVDITVHHTGHNFAIRATQVALGGTSLWRNGSSATVLHGITHSQINGLH